MSSMRQKAVKYKRDIESFIPTWFVDQVGRNEERNNMMHDGHILRFTINATSYSEHTIIQRLIVGSCSYINVTHMLMTT